MTHPPILVLGVGRSGTSAVARVLHERGIYMGSGWPSPQANPGGTFEDRAFHETVVAYTRGEIPTGVLWDRLVLIGQSRERGPWGLKDPRACHCLEELLQVWPDARVVWCARAPQAVVESLGRWYHTDPEAARAETYARLSSASPILARGSARQSVFLDMNHHRSDAWIWERVRRLAA